MNESEATERTDGDQQQVLGANPVSERERGVAARPFPSSRRLVTAAVRSGRRIMPMHGLFDVDVTTARSMLAETDPPLSLTAFVVASVGRAAAMHPQVHAYRDWRGRLVEHRHVDVQTLIEVPTDQGPFGLVHVVRDADIRGVAEISADLRAVKTDAASTTAGRLLSSLAPAAGHAPGLSRAMYGAMSRSRRPSGHRHGAGDRCRHVRRRRRLRHRATYPCLTRRGRGRTQQTSSRSGRPGRSAGRARSHRHDRSQRCRRSACHPVRCRSPRAAAQRRGTHITVPALM